MSCIFVNFSPKIEVSHFLQWVILVSIFKFRSSNKCPNGHFVNYRSVNKILRLTIALMFAAWAYTDSSLFCCSPQIKSNYWCNISTWVIWLHQHISAQLAVPSKRQCYHQSGVTERVSTSWVVAAQEPGSNRNHKGQLWALKQLQNKPHYVHLCILSRALDLKRQSKKYDPWWRCFIKCQFIQVGAWMPAPNVRSNSLNSCAIFHLRP